jgi:hypothetical protein
MRYPLRAGPPLAPAGTRFAREDQDEQRRNTRRPETTRHASLPLATRTRRIGRSGRRHDNELALINMLRSHNPFASTQTCSAMFGASGFGAALSAFARDQAADEPRFA